MNKSLVSLINVAGGRAVGICGKDGNTLRGRVRDPELGFVGDGPGSYQIWLGGESNLLTLARPFADKVKETNLETFFEPIFA